MKIYHRAVFIAGLLCGLCAIDAWKNFEENQDLVWSAFFLYFMLRCIWIALSKPKDTHEETKS